MLLSLLILSLSFGQLGRIELTPNLTLYLHDLFVLPLLVFNLPRLFKSSPLRSPIVIFALTAILSLLIAGFYHSPTEILSASAYLLRWLAYAAIFGIAFSLPASQKNTLLRWLTLTGIVIAIVGLIQYVFAPDMRFLYALGWDDHYYRLIGAWLDPNFTGILLVLTLILTWPSLLSLLPLTALLLTYSRSSYLAFLVTLMLILFPRHKLRLFVSCLLFVVVLLLLPRPGGEGVNLLRLYSLSNRLDSAKVGWNLFVTHPLTGVGFNLLRFTQANFTSHSGAGLDNSFLFIAATTGTLGLVAYLNLLYQAFKLTSPAGKLSLVAISIHSLFNNSLFYAPVMIWLWLILALTGKIKDSAASPSRFGWLRSLPDPRHGR